MTELSIRFRALVALAVAGILLVPASAEAGPGGKGKASREGRKPDLDRIDPVRFKLEDAIVERAFVTARDGLTQLAIDIIRPDTEESVPTIFFQSPYYNTTGRGYQSERKLPWEEPAVDSASPLNEGGPRVPFPEWYDEYFVPRGYAVVMQDQRGTRNSSGCQMYGAREEITDAVDVIEWIASRPWSNGAVGMTGGSYDGTIAIGAASMAPPALKAVIPIRAIDRWYDYHFFNGLQSAEHIVTPANFTMVREVDDQQNSYLEDPLFPVHVIERKACAASIGALVTAQYSTPYQDSTSAFWAGRDFLRDAQDITAPVFIIHGLLDTNVKTTNAGHLWQALPKGLPKKLWLARMGHADPKAPKASESVRFPFDELFVEYTHRWFAQFLKGIDTGVLKEPPVQIQSESGKWFDASRWPGRTKDVVLYPAPDRSLSANPIAGTLTYTDAVAGGETLMLVSDPLKADLRTAGQAIMQLTYSLQAGGDTTFAYRLEDLRSGAVGTEIASGYARAAYREDIEPRGPSWPTAPVLHQPGVMYEIAFPFVYQDYVVKKGHQLRLVIRADDERSLGGGTGRVVTLELGEGTALVLPTASPRKPA